MAQYIFGGKVVNLTPDAASDIDVTINGVNYTTTYNTSVAQTVTDFVAAHAQDILDNFKYPVLAVDGTGVLELHGASLDYVTAADATLAEVDEAISVGGLVISSRVSGSTVVVSLDTANTSADTVTLTCLNAAHAAEVSSRINELKVKKGGSIIAVDPAIA